MKKFIYIFLVSLFVFVSNVGAQQDKIIIEKDIFPFKKLKVTDKEKGNLPISGGKLKQISNSDALVSSSRSSGSGIGETPGNLSVSLTGAASYDIPIEVPPGIDGIVPEISVSYNSQSGNGLAGYGWNIDGVSVISRIPASKHHDNNIDGIDFDNLDRYALDGNRLILKSGTYGANGAIYETERFSNAKIISHGTSPYGASFGPAYFMVYYPDGSIARYGDSSDSRSHMGYAITYWENPQGVRISYEYMKSNNSQSIKRIKYGSLHTNSPINEIVFHYALRERLEQSYIHDVSIVKSYVLNRIESLSSGTRYRSYSIYHNSNARTTLEYERVSSIKEYSGDNTESHSSISFSYPNSNSSIDYDGLTTDLGLANIEQRNAKVLSMDMTGNGKMDFIVYPNEKNKFWTFSDIQSGGYNYPYEYNTGNFEAVFPSLLLNHQNKVLSGQGLTVVQKGSGSQINFKVYSKAPPSAGGVPLAYNYTKIWNAPTYTYQYSPTSSTQKQIPREYVSGDFDGDGLTDVLAINKPYTNRYCYEYECPGGGGGDPIDPIDEIRDLEDVDEEIPGGGSSTCYSCSTYTVNSRRVDFINLRRDVSTGFVNYAGNIQLNLSGNYSLQTGDFNGDGKTDLLHITDGRLYVYSLNNSNALSLLWQVTDSSINVEDAPMLGDFNGDGKTDFMAPTANNSNSFNMFISTGTRFKKGTYTQPFTYIKTNFNGNNGVLSGHNLVPLDVNGDGKTDIVEYNTVTYNDSPFPWVTTPEGTQTIKIYNNLRINNPAIQARILFDYGGTATKTGNLKHFPIPVFLTSSQKNKNLDFASISNNWVTNFSFTHDHREDVLLKTVNNNGMSYEIDYSSLDPEIYNNEFYTQVYQEGYNQVYPNIDLKIAPSTRVVTTLKRYAYLSSGTEMTKRIYAYKGAVYNAEGLGFLGFEAIAQSNWHTGSSDRIFSISKFDPSLRGAMVEEYSTANYFSFTTPTSNYINKTAYQYSSSLSSSKVFKLWMDSSFNQNYLEGTFTNTTYQYDAYNNPILISANFMGGSKYQSITYSNNSSTSNYHIGRPTNSASSEFIGNEVFNSEQQFIYSGYLLTQRKTRGNGNLFDTETYNYDTFGNITKRTTIPNGGASRETNFQYDPTGRFTTKNIDTEGLETTYQYNIANGNLVKEINPFGQETSFEYDSWDRQVKIIDYLGKEVSTNYTEVNNAYIITESADDGSGMIIEYDQLQRVSVIKEKNLFGEWINKKYKYDALDRLVKESEPYTGNSPSQWNETTYDLYSRPISQELYTGREINISYNNLTTTVNDGVKTVTSTRNQLGNVTTVTDPGGTINYTYYGNGNLKSTNSNGVIVTIEQDDWGRKTKLTDPSAGVYEYTYNGYGEITNETTPKGATDYVYSPLGRLLEKNITGDNTDMSILYTYDSTYKFLSAISTTSSDGNNSNYNYSYDNYIRLIGVSESNPYAEFTKQYTYDDFGRINTEQYYGKLLSNNKTSTKKIKNEYQNGGLKTIKDFGTNANIWNATSVNARGQLTSVSIGNSIIDSKSYDAYGYLTNTNITGPSSQVLMQLTTDFNEQRGTLNSRSNSMFSWSETFEYDNLDRLINFNDNDGDNNLTYDNLGRITHNNTVGDYNYSGTSYQLDNIDLNSQGDIYYQQNQLEQIKYNAFKKPFEINEEGKEKIGFQYNAFMGRSHMFYGGTEDNISQRNNRKHYSFDGSMEISYNEEEDNTLFVTYIGGDAYDAPAIWRSEQGPIIDSNYYYLHRDYLGSILLITDGNGNAKEKRHFDAWGKTVKVTDGNNNTLDKLTFLDRGYTGHEHLQGVGLIHMNGRLYDPNLKRFLSPDNYIQDLTNTQNFNRYGYVLNNPLMYIDPSGETGEDPFGNGLGAAGLAGLVASIYATFEGTSFRGFRNWIGRNFQSAGDHISKPFREVGRFFKRLFGGEKKPPVEYSNYQGLSSDPLAGSSANTQNSSFVGGGAENSGLGITVGDVADVVTDFIPFVSSGKDIVQGFRDGNWWQVIGGIGGGILDVVTLGSASLVKGAIKTGIKQGVKFYGKKALTNDRLVQKAANFAQKAIKGTDRFAGTQKHKYARDLLQRYERRFGSRGFEYDKFFNNGKGNRGFLDIYDEASKKIYDFKFGTKGWTKGQFEKYSRNFPGFDIDLIRPQ